MNHAGGGMYGTGPDPAHKPMHVHIQEVPEDKPTRDEISRVSDWWFEKRDKLAEMFGVEPSDVPGSAVWFLDIYFKPTEKDIARAQELAKELGLFNG